MVYPRPIDGYVGFLLLGLGTGAVYASLALGLVLVHRVSGVVNFSQGATAMLAAYLFVALEPAIGVVPALGASVVASAVLGLLAHQVVFRPLADAPALAGVAASAGLLTALQATATLAFGPDSRPVPPLLPARAVHIGGTIVPGDRLMLAAVVIAIAVALWAVSRFTRFGLACRAASEDRRSVALLGWSPDALTAASWALAGVVGGLGAVLAGPITALDPVSSTLLVVPALAAAVFGRMSSIGLTVAAALALGMAQSELLVLQDHLSWLPRAGIREALPLLVIVVALALGAGRRLARTGPTESRLPVARASKHLARSTVASVVAGIVALAVLGGQDRLALVNSLVAIVVCLSVVLLTGFVGQISLAQMAFAGLGGFGLAVLGGRLGWPFPVAPLAAAVVAGLAGLLVGLPALRVRGTSLAIVTLAAAVAMEDLVFKSPALTGGLRGSSVPDLRLGGPGAFGHGLLVLGVAAASAVGVARLRAGRLGRRFLAVRANERAARAIGIDVVATRLTAFGLSAFLAGLGGALLGYTQGQLSFGSFGVFVSLSVLAVTYLGGIATVSGAVVGGLLVADGLVFRMLDRVAGLGRFQLLVSGVGLVAIAILRPEGLTGRRPRP
ncbi:MAG: ABC transporter permease subunit [Acidimicrobiales bacterium]